jgi:hypothetical protein
VLNNHRLIICVGKIKIGVTTISVELAKILEQRYSGFLLDPKAAICDYEIEVFEIDQLNSNSDQSVKITCDDQNWTLTRGGFRASWNNMTRRGQVWQTANPYMFDGFLRIIHTLILAPGGGFLLHASSVIRNGKAFAFTGVSGAGKTTISRLAPKDTIFLTDEISYVTRDEGSSSSRLQQNVSKYLAYGTPFFGEFGENGASVRGPLAAIYLLEKGQENKIEDIKDPLAATRALLRNVLFFAHEPEMVRAVFEGVAKFAETATVKRLTFYPDRRVWDLIK